ncbi:MAG: hypothetical protein JRJ68_01285 [Deltaproteobacteria bacterium]|nr:hypothetical protein [Deltaproteobacteria bacterium]
MKNVIFVAMGIALSLLVAACGPKEKVTSSWADPSLKGYSADNILVLGMGRDEVNLKLWENVFVDLFSADNVRAMASHKVIGTVPEPDEKIIREAIKKTGASSVLITHMVDSKSKTNNYHGSLHFVPGGFYGGMYGYYGNTYSSVYTPPSHITRTVVRLESNLYDVATASLVWSAQSEAINPKLLRTDFERIVGLLIADMKKSGVVH